MLHIFFLRSLFGSKKNQIKPRPGLEGAGGWGGAGGVREKSKSSMVEAPLLAPLHPQPSPLLRNLALKINDAGLHIYIHV